jgi:hypothetical protein
MCCLSNAISSCVVDAGLRNMCDDVFTTSPTRSPPATTVASTPSFFSPLPSCGTPVPSTLSYALTRDVDTGLPVCAALAWLPWSRDYFAGER